MTPDAAAAEHRRERLLCSCRDPNCEAEVVIELLRSERVSTCASSSARSSPERGSGARDDPRAARRPPRRRARLAGAHRRRDRSRRLACSLSPSSSAWRYSSPLSFGLAVAARHHRGPCSVRIPRPGAACDGDLEPGPLEGGSGAKPGKPNPLTRATTPNTRRTLPVGQLALDQGCPFCYK
jgi:hypothetical protein